MEASMRDTVRMLSATQQTQEEVERTKQQLSFEVERVKQDADMKAEKECLMRSVKEKEAELSSLRQEAQLQQSSLRQERERSNRELEELQGKLRAKTSVEEQMKKKLLEEQFALLQGTIAEAENIIQDAVAKLDDPLHIRCTSSPDAGGLLRSLTQFSHLAADTIVNGSATAHMAPTDQADRLTENCRGCATQSLQYLKELKSKNTLQRADPDSVRMIVQKILYLGQVRRNSRISAEMLCITDSWPSQCDPYKTELGCLG
ncbi:hypothetical protein XENOCAPTIV_014704 [Xenoophorus captivus]|uniref:Huntingtin-interacting protein 1 clathrin-binding domain-containing protein n=1 Tax=Xenoophorus captivus TaxID=1517983 RepID=A0ABV0SBB5_9TELE